MAVGNPPFVRFQFVDDRDRSAATQLAEKLGVSFHGVSNLWIPVLLASLSRLRRGGGLAFVVPTECLTGCSAQVARDWLLQHVDSLRLDLFPPGSFPGRGRPEVMVLSGSRADDERASPVQITITEHSAHGNSRTWRHAASHGQSWTRYLLEPRHLVALAEARDIGAVSDLRDTAAFEVSIVTGANDFFTVSRSTLDEYDLWRWARPLLPRVRHVNGLTYDAHDQDRTDAAAARAWLLDFGSGKDDPERFAGPARYLREGKLGPCTNVTSAGSGRRIGAWDSAR